MRVVFDTNIFVSALVIPGGRAEKALLRVVEGEDQLLLSKAILDELLSVLARKFSRDKEALSRVALFLSELGITVSPQERLGVLEDEADNRILECGVAGNADVIVTGDKAMLELDLYRGIRVISLKRYLGEYQP